MKSVICVSYCKPGLGDLPAPLHMALAASVSQAAQPIQPCCGRSRPLRGPWLCAPRLEHTSSRLPTAGHCLAARHAPPHSWATPREPAPMNDEDQRRPADVRERSEGGRAHAGRAQDAVLMTGLCSNRSAPCPPGPGSLGTVRYGTPTPSTEHRQGEHATRRISVSIRECPCSCQSA